MPTGDDSVPQKGLSDPDPTLLSTLRRLVLLIVIVYLMAMSPIAWLQRTLIYHPNRCPTLSGSQALVPQTVVDVTVKSHDGLDLHGWLALAGSSSLGQASDVKQAIHNGRPIVLYFPGNAGNRSYRREQLTLLGLLNANVVIMDYRGYAENEGTPTEKQLAADARSIWNHLTREMGVPADRVIIYGESLGGGVAVRLASELCEAGIEPGGLIIQSTFSSLVDAARIHFSFLPVSLLLVDRFPSDRRIQQVTCPILQIHGSKDRIVPFVLGQKLFDAAPAQSSNGMAKRQHVMKFTDHNDVYCDGVDHIGLEEQLKSFIDEVAQNSPPGPDPANGVDSNERQSLKLKPEADAIDGTTIVTSVIVLLIVIAIWLFRSRR